MSEYKTSLPEKVQKLLGFESLYFRGNLNLLKTPRIAVIGSRDASPDALKEAFELGRALSVKGFTTVSGLAKGIDSLAHRGAMLSGPTIGVIGTPLSVSYPQENRSLQEQIGADHLLVSPFPEGSKTGPSNFPRRNKVMAYLSDATVVVAATENSGTRHQVDFCYTIDKPVYVSERLTDDSAPSWIREGLDQGKIHPLTDLLSLFEEK